jgi:hypothetical protein
MGGYKIELRGLILERFYHYKGLLFFYSSQNVY